MSKTTSAPDRLRWAVDLLDVQPGDRILEVGFGRGASVDLVCQRVDGGHVTAIDRSRTAVEAAHDRNSAHIDAGRASFEEVAVEEVSFADGSFDKVFAINVNLFWTQSSSAVLADIRRWLTPGGALYLAYEPPSGSRVDELVKKIRPAMEAEGFDVEIVTGRASCRDRLVALVGRA